MRHLASLLVTALVAVVGIALDTAAPSQAAGPCVKVSSPTLTALEASLQHGAKIRGGSLRAVRSEDFESDYFVAAELDGPGLDGNGHVAVWATNKIKGFGVYFVAEGMAKQFSDYGSRHGFSINDDGAKEAKDCTFKAMKDDRSDNGVSKSAFTSKVKAGGYASLTVAVKPKSRCSITVTYSTGESKAKGLNAITGATINWRWRVGSSTKPGKWPVRVTCGKAGKLNLRLRVIQG